MSIFISIASFGSSGRIHFVGFLALCGHTMGAKRDASKLSYQHAKDELRDAKELLGTQRNIGLDYHETLDHLFNLALDNIQNLRSGPGPQAAKARAEATVAEVVGNMPESVEIAGKIATQPGFQDHFLSDYRSDFSPSNITLCGNSIHS